MKSDPPTRLRRTSVHHWKDRSETPASRWRHNLRCYQPARPDYHDAVSRCPPKEEQDFCPTPPMHRSANADAPRSPTAGGCRAAWSPASTASSWWDRIRSPNPPKSGRTACSPSGSTTRPVISCRWKEAGEQVLKNLTQYRPVTELAESGSPDDLAAGGEPMFAIRKEKSRGALAVESRFTDQFRDSAAKIYPLLRAELDRLGLKDVALRLPDRITAMLQGKETSIAGFYFQKAITVALDYPKKFDTLHHEVVHALRDLGLFSDGEWGILARASERKWKTQFDIDRDYGHASEDRRSEEGVAHAYAAWADGEIKVDGRIARLFKRIRDFFEAVRNAFHGLGFRTAEDVFRDIRSGEIGRRPRRSSEGDKTEPQFARREREPVVRLKGHELGPTASFQQLRAAAYRYYDENFVKAGMKVRNDQTGREISFSPVGLRRTIRVGEDLMRAIPAIPDMLRKGKLLQSEADREGRRSIKALHTFAAAVEIGDRRLDVVLIVRETKDGTYQYSLHRDRDFETGARPVSSRPQGGETSEKAPKPPALEGGSGDLNIMPRHEKKSPAIESGEQHASAPSVEDTRKAPSPGGDTTNVSRDAGEDNGDEPMFAIRREAEAAPTPHLNARIRARIEQALSSSAVNKFIEKTQDLSHPVRLLQDELEVRRKGAFDDPENFYVRKRLYPGRVGAWTDTFNRRHLDPIVKLLKANEISLHDAGDFLYALHAAERNAAMDEINPGLSGEGSVPASKVYEKYGTTFGTRLLVIDKVAPVPGEKPVLADVASVEELMRTLEPIRNGREAEQRRTEPGRAEVAEGSQGGRAGSLPASSEPGTVRDRDAGGGLAQEPGHGGAGGPGGRPVRLEGGERDALAPEQPERTLEGRAAGQPANAVGNRGRSAKRGGPRAGSDLEPAGQPEPGAAAGSERVELEHAAPGSQGTARRGDMKNYIGPEGYTTQARPVLRG